MDKQTLRKEILSLRNDHTAETLAAWSLTIMQQIENHSAFKSAQTVFIYHGMPGEVQTADFIRRWAEYKRFILPVVDGKELRLCQYTGDENLKQSNWGIMEPVGQSFEHLEQIDVSIVPGLAFDYRMNRLGYGRGYYDRTLSKLRTYNIGVCFDFQLIDHVPTEAHDLTMDEILTESHQIKI